MILGIRTRLSTIIRKVKAAVALAMPRTLRRTMPPMVLARPKACSIRFRKRSEVVEPSWRVARRSISVLRTLPSLLAVPLTAMCGETLRVEAYT